MTNEQYYNQHVDQLVIALSTLTDVDAIKDVLEQFRHFVSKYEMDKAQATMFNMSIVEYNAYMDQYTSECMEEDFGQHLIFDGGY